MPFLRHTIGFIAILGSVTICEAQIPSLPPDTPAPAHRAERVRRQANPTQAKQESPSTKTTVETAEQTGKPPLAPSQMPSVAPRFQLSGDRLTVIAPNSSMADVIAGLRQTLGIPIDVEGGPTGERIAAQIGPAPVRSVLLSLFDGSKYDYFILGSALDPHMVSKVILTPKSGGGNIQTAGPAPAPANTEPSEDVEQQEEPEQPEEENPSPAPIQENTPRQQPEVQESNPNNVKTPEQLLEELKQMEKQKQQQQQNQPNPPQEPDRPR
jgi:hypothetical protein